MQTLLCCCNYLFVYLTHMSLHYRFLKVIIIYDTFNPMFSLNCRVFRTYIGDAETSYNVCLALRRFDITGFLKVIFTIIPSTYVINYSGFPDIHRICGIITQCLSGSLQTYLCVLSASWLRFATSRRL